jgi:hypothetical protein
MLDTTVGKPEVAPQAAWVALQGERAAMAETKEVTSAVLTVA